MAEFSVGTGNNAYGQLQGGFEFKLQDGYSVLTGPNNVGKSAILQLLFTRAIDETEYGPDGVALIRADRAYVGGTTETGGRTLHQYNLDLKNLIGSAPQQYENQIGPSQHELPRLLVNHTNFRRQADQVDAYLERLELPDLILRDNQQAYFNNVAVQMQGSGLRGLFATVCALTDQRLKLILIDEPETSLEPRRQKALRDLLVDRAASVKIAIATHSHLFLNRGQHNISLNHVVSVEDNVCSVHNLSSSEELYSVTFDLLGSDTEDLFFPKNYLVVEGASDQTVIDRIRELLGQTQTQVKILAAGGIGNVKARLQAVENSLLPLVVNDSPYRERVVALVDKPSSKSDEAKVASLQKFLGDRLYVLPAASLEEFLSESLFARAQMDRETILNELAQLRQAGPVHRLHARKGEIARRLAAVLVKDDLEGMGPLREALEKAAAS